ncbi:MAG TPA: PAS domain S-box protein, partial [Chitinophagaceae bacterium]|nr:PAS domain S-box protein [Chitinophagaceae bacterium]
TPLTLILGSLEELLNNGKRESNEDRGTIETTHRNALRLLRLVNNLFDFNRIEAGKAKATFIDVTEEVLARKKIEESEQRFSSLVKDATVGIIVLQGEDLKVAVVNAAYGKLIGRTPEQLTGKELFHVIPEAEAMFRPILDKVRATGEPVYQYGQPYRVFAEGNKEEGYLNLVYQPYKNLDGEITGVMVLCQDVTEQVLSHRMAEESEERLSIALDGAELGTYDFFPQTGMLLWSRKTKELFGLPPDAEVTYDVYLKGLHPDDREKADMAAQTAVGPQNGGYYENEYRTIGITDGRLRWVRSKGKISFDEEGKPVRLTGIIQEITQQKELLANLQLQSLVLDRMDEGVSISNEEGLILFTNPAEDKMFGYEAGELIGKHVTIQNAYPPEENEIIVSGVIAELKEKGYWSGEWHNRKKDGTSFFTHSFITTLKADGKTVFVCVQRDVTQDKEVAGKLAYRKALLEAQNEAVPDAILVVDTKGKILSYNRHFATLWNIPQEIIDRKDDTGALQFAMTQVADPQRFIDRVNYCYAHPNTKDYEEVLFKDGRIIERCGNAIIGEDGIKYGWIWHFRDVTEQKRASEILRASEDRYQNFIRQSTEGIWRFEVESPISTALPVSEQIDLFFQHAFLAECNDAMAKMYGYEDAREMIGMRLSQFFPRDEASEAYLSHFITSRYRVEAAESKETDRHGATVYFMNNLIGIVEDGKLIRAWGTQRNITAQKEAEESLKESESLFRTLAETLPQMIWVRNTNGNIEYSSKNWETYSGIKDMREAWRQITHPHDWEPIMSVWQKAMQAGDPFKYEARLRNKEGEYRWHYAVGEPVKDESGTVIKYIGALTDIHAQKTFSEKLENEVAQRTHELRNKNKELENAQSFLQQLIDSSVEYVAVLDKGLRYITVNKKFEKALGLSRENIRGKSVLDISPKTKGYFQLDCIQKAFQGETVHLDKNASVSKPDVFIDTYYIPYVVGENIEGVIVMARDVTDIVKAEKLLERRNIDLAQAQSFLQTVLDLSVEMVAAFDTELNYTFLNKKVQEFLGKDSSDVIGKPITAIHPGIENSSTYQQIKRALAGEVVYTDQRESYTRKGHIFESYILPLKDGEQIVGVVTMQRDITQIVRLAENLKQTNQELQRSNEDLQQFAHVASHDLKEPVRKVITFGDRLKRECANELSEKANTYLSKIESSAARMYSMIDGVLLYSSLSALEQTREVIDLNDLMHDITVDLEVPIAEKGATITYKHLPRVEGSSILIYQLLYNMINNSLKFSKEDVSPLIEVTSKIAEPDKLEKLGLTESAKYVTIIIKDNGIGFNNDAAEKIFGTFTRLHAKDKFEGTGLGLALCKKIAERHGGAVYAEGKEGEGATFYILLPL